MAGGMTKEMLIEADSRGAYGCMVLLALISTLACVIYTVNNDAPPLAAAILTALACGFFALFCWNRALHRRALREVQG